MYCYEAIGNADLWEIAGFEPMTDFDKLFLVGRLYRLYNGTAINCNEFICCPICIDPHWTATLFVCTKRNHIKSTKLGIVNHNYFPFSIQRLQVFSILKNKLNTF